MHEKLSNERDLSHRWRERAFLDSQRSSLNPQLFQYNGQRFGCSDWLGVASEPVLEACRADARVIAGNEALIVHRDAGAERLGIGDYRPCVPGCGQELPHELVLPNPFGTGQLEGAVQRPFRIGNRVVTILCLMQQTLAL